MTDQTTAQSNVQRTLLQAHADSLDCDLYRIICRLERLYERQPQARDKIHESLQRLRLARSPLRTLMHPLDRERTL